MQSFEAHHSRMNYSRHDSGAENNFLPDKSGEERVESVGEAAVWTCRGDVNATIERVATLIDV